MSLTEAQLLEDIRRRLFSPTATATPRAIGIELELIPVLRSTRKPALVASDSGSATAPVLSRLARQHDWRERSIENDPPSWELADGARISFEPGGQIEISSAPHASASTLIDSTRALVSMIREAMIAGEIDLISRGVDPYNDIAAVPLQLHRDRYTRMTRYFDSIGPPGVRMMRQTAALQINVERGEDPARRWKLLNSLAPIVVALFANSREYAGSPTRWASYRAHLWRTLDGSRTGVLGNGSDPAKEYLEFALDALAMRSGSGASPYRAFREWMRDSAVDEDEWLFHLSTLFPEVRAKEYFELRSADTLDAEWLAAPVVFVAGIVYSARSAQLAETILPEPGAEILERAGRLALQDPELRKLSDELVELALSGAAELGRDYLAPEHIAVAREYLREKLASR